MPRVPSEAAVRGEQCPCPPAGTIQLSADGLFSDHTASTSTAGQGMEHRQRLGWRLQEAEEGRQRQSSSPDSPEALPNHLTAYTWPQSGNFLFSGGGRNKAVSLSVAQAGLKIIILLPLSLSCWDYRHEHHVWFNL